MEEKRQNNRFHLDALVLDRIHTECTYACAIYEASRIEVVLGRSSNMEGDVHVHNCLADGVPISRRSGGGGTVVLAPGVIILSIAGMSGLPFHLREHMHAVNRRIINVLEELGASGLSIEGISDIALGGRKILGSSLYRRRDLVLYQGSLLLNPDLSLMSRYLKQPQKQPEYRRERPHVEFVTSLHGSGYMIPISELIGCLEAEFGQSSPWSPPPTNPAGG